MKKRVLVLQGIPASGKTYFAQNYKKIHPNVEIIERDEIREEIQPGYFKQKPNNSVEHQVTLKANSLLKTFLADEITKTIIISDTNLNPQRLEKLLREIKSFNKNAEIVVETMPDSSNLDLCAKRNRTREKKVPEDVLTRFYRRYLSQFLPKVDFAGKQLLFVGDVHSQYSNLQNLVNHFGFKNYYYVFLGDINDSRYPLTHTSEDPEISFLKCYSLVRMMVEFGHATLVHSNHQKNLIAALRNRRKKASWGLKSTLDELSKIGLIEVEYEEDSVDNEKIKSLKSTEEALDVANWFDTRPFYFESKGVVGIHAQYLPSYCSNPYSVLGRGVEAAIYGTRRSSENHSIGDRISWWEVYNSAPYVVSGHYHHFYIGPHCSVIDSGCGEGGPLTAFNYTTKEVFQFGSD